MQDPLGGLAQLGWRPFFAEALARVAGPTQQAARVVRQDRGEYLVHTGDAVRYA